MYISEEVQMAGGMTKERQGEIALMYLKDRIKRDGIHVSDLKRSVHGKAKEIGIPAEEAREFAFTIIREITDEALASLNSE